jgi:hypothetical protein
MVMVMYYCPQCGQRTALETGDPQHARPLQPDCPVCGAEMKTVSRVCDCGKQIG